MIEVMAAVVGLGLVVAVWLSVLRAVFVPRQRPPRAARWTMRLVAAVMFGAGRLLPGRRYESVVALCAPLALFGMFFAWLVGLVAGFALFASGVSALAWNAGSLESFLTLDSGGSAKILGLLLWWSAAVLLAVLTVYLVRLTNAYSRRELLVASLSAQATQPPDAERVIASYARSDSPGHLDAVFAAWTAWLADVRCTHLGYPALVYYRPASELCWLEAVVIILDAAALVDAIAPSWALPHTRVVLDTGVRCLAQLEAELGIAPPRTLVSLHGREQRGFADTIQLLGAAGLPAERSQQEAWSVFQGARTRYAPHAAAIAELLQYAPGDGWADNALAHAREPR